MAVCRNFRILLTLVSCVVAGRAGEGEKLNGELKELTKARIKAVAERNVAELDRICAADYHLISPSGSQLDLNAAKAAVMSSQVESRYFTLQSYQTFVAADASMAFAVAEVKEQVVLADDTGTNNLLLTEVYVKHKGAWRIQLTHVSRKTCYFPE